MRLKRSKAEREAPPAQGPATNATSTESGERPAEDPVERGRPARERRPRRGYRARNAGAATVGAVGAGVVMLARLVLTAAVLIAVLIGLAIILRDVDANASNSIVKGIHEGANFFAGGFNGLIKSAGHAKRELSINWGIALLVFLIGGALIARAISRIGLGGVGFHRAHRAQRAV